MVPQPKQCCVERNESDRSLPPKHVFFLCRGWSLQQKSVCVQQHSMRNRNHIGSFNKVNLLSVYVQVPQNNSTNYHIDVPQRYLSVFNNTNLILQHCISLLDVPSITTRMYRVIGCNRKSRVPCDSYVNCICHMEWWRTKLSHPLPSSDVYGDDWFDCHFLWWLHTFLCNFDACSMSENIIICICNCCALIVQHFIMEWTISHPVIIIHIRWIRLQIRHTIERT